MVLSNAIKYGTVTWTALSAVIDDLFDTDRNPNASPIPNVVVTFTASTPRVVVQDPAPVTVFLQSITARTNEDGVLVGPDGVEGIKLVSTDNPLASPVNFTYRVNISGVGVPMTLDVAIPSDAIIDLSHLIPISTSAGKVLPPVRGEKGEPGGWTTGANLGSSDLDTIVAPGLYFQASTTNALNPDLHYPPIPNYGGIARGVLHVSSWSGGAHVMQEYHHIGYTGNVANSTSERPSVVWRRYKDVLWGNWFMFSPARSVTDGSGFRTHQIWDDAVNAWADLSGPGGTTRPETMSATADMNTFVKDGRYSIENGTALTNVPTDLMQQYGTLEVISTNSPSRLVQFFYPTASSQAGKIYWIRSLVGGTWTAWAAIRPSNSGGLTTPDLLSTTDLNTIITDGVYRQNMASYATLERNYPSPGAAGILTVKTMSVVYTMQTYEPISGSLKGPRFISTRFSTTDNKWSEWRTYATQRVDNTVGRTIYTWDETANREQLIYGDTGRRDITSLLGSDYSGGTLTLRRVGSMVFVAATAISKSSTAGTGNLIVANLPNGFRPDAAVYGYTFRNIRSGLPAGGGLYITDPSISVDYVNFTYTTSDPWPTSLPGSATIAIPNT